LAVALETVIVISVKESGLSDTNVNEPNLVEFTSSLFTKV